MINIKCVYNHLAQLFIILRLTEDACPYNAICKHPYEKEPLQPLFLYPTAKQNGLLLREKVAAVRLTDEESLLPGTPHPPCRVPQGHAVRYRGPPVSLRVGPFAGLDVPRTSIQHRETHRRRQY